MTRNTAIITFLIFIAFNSWGQQKNYTPSQISIANGLLHNTVECIFKDSENYIWFGTHNGLNRFDGSNIISYQYNLSDSNSLPGNKIASINEDADGDLWIGTTGNGLSRFDKKNEIFHNYQSNSGFNGLPHNIVSNIKVFSDNSVWICTNAGLAQYNRKTNNFINYPYKNGLDQDLGFVVYDIIESKTGEVFVASNHNYIYKLSRENGTYTPLPYSRKNSLMGNYRKHLFEDSKGNLWISAFAHGLVKLNIKTGKSKLFTKENTGLPIDLLNGNSVIKNNKLWLSTDGAGIIILDLITETFSKINQSLNSSPRIYSNKIYSLYIDNENIVWIGTFDEGVNILNPNQTKISSLQISNGKALSYEGMSVLSIFEDSKDQLWIGTDDDGLFCIKNNEHVVHYTHNPDNPNSLSSNRIICIAEDRKGNILLGTYTGGLVVFNETTNKFKRYMQSDKKPNSISANHVWEIFIDSEDRIWLGMLGTGLDLFDIENETFTPYGPSTDNYNKINYYNVTSIIEDRNGDIWFGTEGMGINILDKQTGQMFNSINSSQNVKLSNNNITCIFEDKQGIIWIGTGNGGLNRYDKFKETIDYYYIEHGLPSNIVYSITEDEKNNLWLGTAYGISRFNKNNQTFRNYDIKDGLHGFVCNRKGILKSKNGSIFIGTTNGLNVFKPDSIKDIDFIPEVFFTKLRIQNKPINAGDVVNGRVVLDKPINYTKQIFIYPQDKVFTLEFAAKTYTLPDKCSFKYQLDGFEDIWKTTDASRQHVSYSNLNPGNYKFRIRAANSDGLWNANETVIDITVLPSFWQSIWFKLIVALLAVFVFYVWNSFKLKEKEKLFLKEKNKQEQKIIELEKENLESELNNQTFNILNRNRALLNHKRRLSTLVKKIEGKNKATIESIIEDIDKEINEEKDWKHIEPRLDKVYNNFMTTLKDRHENLTQNELRVAAYVRMGLSTKEISELLQKTTKAIDNERYRLRKKLDIPLNDSLKKYLLDL